MMKRRAWTLFSLFTAVATAVPASAVPSPLACQAQSGPTTAALVELYTSEGCSSCPPADRQLSHLREALDAGATAVPLSLHVDYWDYIGWKDPFAQSEFARRQSWLAHANQQPVVYTPHFFVGGTELRSWSVGARDAIRRINAQAAEAQVRIEASLASSNALSVEANATARAAGDSAELYLAVTEDGLVSKVARGENGGVTLAHDHVVRAWIGPIPLSGGEARVRREITLPVSWNREQLAVVGFVEDKRSGRILQAVATKQCFHL